MELNKLKIGETTTVFSEISIRKVIQQITKFLKKKGVPVQNISIKPNQADIKMWDSGILEAEIQGNTVSIKYAGLKPIVLTDIFNLKNILLSSLGHLIPKIKSDLKQWKARP